MRSLTITLVKTLACIFLSSPALAGECRGGSWSGPSGDIQSCSDFYDRSSCDLNSQCSWQGATGVVEACNRTERDVFFVVSFSWANSGLTQIEDHGWYRVNAGECRNFSQTTRDGRYTFNYAAKSVERDDWWWDGFGERICFSMDGTRFDRMRTSTDLVMCGGTFNHIGSIRSVDMGEDQFERVEISGEGRKIHF